MKLIVGLIVIMMVVALLVAEEKCLPGPNPRCRDWYIGMQSVRPSGVVVHGHAKGPLHQGSNGRLDGNVHGSHVLGGPYNGAGTVGGGLNYQHNSGLHGGVDATHTRHGGTAVSGTVGGSGRVGPGTLSVGGGLSSVPGSSKLQGQVGATYTVPLP